MILVLAQKQMSDTDSLQCNRYYMDSSTISKSLLELSDAIENLAMIIADQKQEDNEAQIKQFSLIVKKFSKTTEHITPNEKRAFESGQIISKHKKGYLNKWLLDKNIYIGKSVGDLQVSKKLYDVADYLTDHYFLLSDFYSQLKRSQNLKHDFQTHTTKQSISYIRKWCEMLHKNKIIDSFYFMDSSVVDIDIAEIHKATYFINGYWLEIFLRKELAIALRKNIGKIDSFDILAQVEMVKPNKKTSEVDLLFMLNDQVYWFECKSGDIGHTYFERFSEHRRLFDLPSERSLLVVPTMHMNQAESVKRACGMNMLYATLLEQQLEQLLFS